MSDKDDGDREQEQEYALRRKRPRACDACRRRKVKCDGLEDNAKTCTNCVTYKEKCTYTPTKRHNADEEYIKQLEAEVVRLQFLVEQLQARLYQKDKEKQKSSSGSGSSPSAYESSPSPRSTPPVTTNVTFKRKDNEAEDILAGFKFMTLNDSRHVHYMGRSSYMALFNTAMSLKREVAEEDGSRLPNTDKGLLMISHLRPSFWTHLPDHILPDAPYTDFPEPGLMTELLETYFHNVHDNFPLLHRPTFLRGITSGLHYTSEGFGAIVLLVCAIGARFSVNPATLPPGATSWQYAGFRWYDQVRATRKVMPLMKATVYDLQVSALAAAYIGTLGLPFSNFATVGYALRLAQDLGAHRRTTYRDKRTVEDELLLRAFWCLIALDRSMATTLGRSCDMQDEHFDVDYPTECDDEYWVTDNPQEAFKQPVGKPSTVSHFVWHLKLLRINAHTLRTIYSLQGDTILNDAERAQEVIADLDSELNNWVDSLPQHLKYDANREDLPFAVQAASLHAAYHNQRIFVHRPFITSPRPVILPVPSLTICTNAARACIQTVDRYIALHGPVLLYHYHIGTILQSGVIMLLHVWQVLRTGSSSDVTPDLVLVKTAQGMLKSLEMHWDVAGRYWDILNDLMIAIEERQHRKVHGTPPRDTASPEGSYLTIAPVQRQGSHGSLFAIQHASAPSSSRRPSLVNTTYNSPALVGGDLLPGGNPLDFEAHPWESASAGSSQQRYYSGQPGDPDLDAIFADLIPRGSYNSAYAEGFPPDQQFDGASGSQPYGGGYVPNWNAGSGSGS